MGPFYLIIAELMLWFSVITMIISLIYVAWNYSELLIIKLKVKKISIIFNLFFAIIILILFINILVGSLWTYEPNNFGYTFTTLVQVSSSIIYTAISFVFSLVLVIYLLFSGKYFFIGQRINGQIIIFGLGQSKNKVNFKFKKTLVGKEYQQLLKA